MILTTLVLSPLGRKEQNTKIFSDAQETIERYDLHKSIVADWEKGVLSATCVTNYLTMADFDRRFIENGGVDVLAAKVQNASALEEYSELAWIAGNYFDGELSRELCQRACNGTPFITLLTHLSRGCTATREVAAFFFTNFARAVEKTGSKVPVDQLRLLLQDVRHMLYASDPKSKLRLDLLWGMSYLVGIINERLGPVLAPIIALVVANFWTDGDKYNFVGWRVLADCAVYSVNTPFMLALWPDIRHQLMRSEVEAPGRILSKTILRMLHNLMIDWKENSGLKNQLDECAQVLKGKCSDVVFLTEFKSFEHQRDTKPPNPMQGKGEIGYPALKTDVAVGTESNPFVSGGQGLQSSTSDPSICSITENIREGQSFGNTGLTSGCPKSAESSSQSAESVLRTGTGLETAVDHVTLTEINTPHPDNDATAEISLSPGSDRTTNEATANATSPPADVEITTLDPAVFPADPGTARWTLLGF